MTTLARLSIHIGADSEGVTTSVDAAARKLRDLERAAQEVTLSTRSPFEILKAEMRSLSAMYRTGMIDAQTYGRAVQKVRDEFNRPAKEALAKEMAETARRAKELEDAGRRVFEATRTPMERLGSEVQRLNGLVRAGAIDWDTYGRAVTAARSAVKPMANADLARRIAENAKQLEQFKREGQALFAATRTPIEKLQTEIVRLDRLLRRGAISWDTYRRATRLARAELLGATSASRILASTLWKGAANMATFAGGFLSLNLALSGLRAGIASMRELHKMTAEMRAESPYAKAASDIASFGQNLSQVDFQRIDNAEASMLRFRAAVDATNTKIASELSPNLQAAADAAARFWTGIIGPDAIEAIGNVVSFVQSAFVNIQSTVSGFYLMFTSAVSTAFKFAEGMLAMMAERIEQLLPGEQFGDEAFFNNWRDKLRGEFKTLHDNLFGGQKMLMDGLSGRAGDAFLNKVDRAAEQANVAATTMEQAATVTEMKAVKLRQLSVGAMERGSSAAVSAINQATWGKELAKAQKPMMEVANKQLAVLKSIDGKIQPLAAAGL